MRRSPLSVLSAALSTLRAQGPLVFAEKLAAKLIMRRLLLLEADLAGAGAMPPAKVPVDIRFLHPSELDLLLASKPEIDRPLAEASLAAGAPCLVALHEGKIVGSTWFARDAIASNWGGVDRPLAQDEAYVFAVHTAPAHRGQGISLALHAHLARYLLTQGVRRAYCLTLPWNRPAQASFRRAGYRVCGQFVWLGFRRFGHTRFIPASD